MKIIIDAHGGDNAPLEVIKGAARAVKELDAKIILVGNEKQISEIAAEEKICLNGINIVHTDDVITMHDEPTSIIKEHKNCSMAKGMSLLAEGEGDAFISAGSTGALVVGARFIVKNVKGVRRASLAALLPSAKGPYMLIDAGANVECRAEFLLKFALLGSAYMSGICGIENPRVGLLNNGTEDTKGTQLQKDAYALLSTAPINFIGNIEAREGPLGGCDVLVTDGFSGNIYLKLVEGMGKMVSAGLKKQLFKNPVRMLGTALVSGGLNAFKKELDYREYGGAPLMGSSKPVIKAHGSADAQVIFNTIRQAKAYVETDVSGRILKLIEETKASEKAETEE